MFNTTNGLQLTAGSSERVRIKTDGKVGIGTTSPAFTIDVAGDAAFRDQVGTGSFGSGFAGHGWRIENTDSKWGLTTDNLTIKRPFLEGNVPASEWFNILNTVSSKDYFPDDFI